LSFLALLSFLPAPSINILFNVVFLHYLFFLSISFFGCQKGIRVLKPMKPKIRPNQGSRNSSHGEATFHLWYLLEGCIIKAKKLREEPIAYSPW
jgi:hypothetical protein